MRESRFDDGAGREARSDARESAFDDVLAVPDDDDDDDEALFISVLCCLDSSRVERGSPKLAI